MNFGADKLDVSNFENGGYYEYLGGLKKCDFTLEFDFDYIVGANGGGNVFDSTGWNAVPGTKLATMQFYLNDTTGPYWELTSAFIETAPMNGDVKTTVNMTITGSASASFKIPSGITTTRALTAGELSAT